MRPTRWYTLVVLAVLSAGAAYLLTDATYDDLPAQHVYSTIWIGLVGAAELYVAVTTRARLAGRARTRPIHPLSVARLVALAKASSPVGAVITGGYAGFFAWVVQRPGVSAANNDARAAAVAVVFGVLLTGAALFLERVCRVPDDPDDPMR